MKVVLPGGSGHLGQLIARACVARGDDVVVLSRGQQPAAQSPDPGPRVVSWDGRTLGAWAAEVDGADVLFNLAGRSVNCRYTPANRREILESRLASTRVLGDAAARARRPPRIWLQSSTATIYAHRYDAANDEIHGVLGGQEPRAPETWRFSIDVATSWERAFGALTLPSTRRLLLRTAIVMHTLPGGAFDVLLGLVRRGLGGTSGDGRQFVSWIHADDFVRVVQWLIDRPDLEGIVNLASPGPLPNADFMRAIREAWGASAGLPSPAWLLEIGALFLRTETELVLKSRRVVSTRLADEGFEFLWQHWPTAASDLVRQIRGRRRN
ncbi:MAG TPA: DUF1731 domain-containing protein [Vicinamibacterales bacterium]|nr:DUF1731 domain-containing protein [Vicinamibacterales bacterium]